MPASDASLFIRPARPTDSSALSRICLLTADAGKSAEPLHTIPELPGLFYACPYVSLPHAGGFVLVRRRTSQQLYPTGGGAPEVGRGIDGEDDVLGYTLFSYDTRAFEQAAERDWFPPLRMKYVKPAEDEWQSEYGGHLTDVDKQYISLLHAPDRAPERCVAFSPAHLHVDILPEAQRQGWGRRLIDTVVKHLRDEKNLSSVWLGMDLRNVDAARFYERLGLRSIEGAPNNYVGLKFDDWSAA